MATAPKGAGFVIPGRKAIAESTARVNDQRQSLAAASGLLKPGEVAGEYNAARLLGTTLGGQLRALTAEDLKVFAANVKKLGKKFTGGITAKQVIDLSAPVDRERANAQIRTAVPMAHKDGVIHFVTNAGPDSKVTRHHVYVEFLNWGAAVASPAAPKDMAKQLFEGRLRWRCDCGRFTYWYSYIATVGQFIYGDQQVNFPKIRNPNLVGVACKHSLRVMQQLSSPQVRARIERMIEDGRKNAPGKVYTMTKKDAQALAAEQTRRADWKRNTVESSAERQLRLAQQRMAAKAPAAARARVAAMSPAQLERERRAFERNLQKLVAMGALKPAQAKAMLAKVGGK